MEPNIAHHPHPQPQPQRQHHDHPPRPQSVSAVAVIDLSDPVGLGGDDDHGLLGSGGVVVIGGEDAVMAAITSGSSSSSATSSTTMTMTTTTESLLGHELLGSSPRAGTGALGNEDDDDEEDDDDDDDDEGDDGCGPECEHAAHHQAALAHAHAQVEGLGSSSRASPPSLSIASHPQAPLTTTAIGGSLLHSPSSLHGLKAASAPGSPTPSTLSTTAPSSAGGKRKRVVLSIHDKQQVLQRLDLGEAPIAIARDFGISRQQVSDIKKNRDRILAFCIDAKHLSTLRRKTLRATTEYHPGVEQELYRWLIRQRRLGRGVTAEALGNKTTDLFMQYASEDAANVSSRAIGIWLRHFRRAHGIKSLTEDELAKLPAKFTPAMDMARPNDGTGHGDAHPSTHATPSSVMTAASPLSAPSTSAAAASLMAPTVTTTAAPPPPSSSALDDVSAYMSGLGAASTATHPHAFLLQNHSPPQDPTSPSPYQMLLLNSTLSAAPATAAAAAAAVTTTTPTTTGMPPTTATTTMSMQQLGSLQKCVQLAHELTAQMGNFERDIAVKLEFLDARVEKLCFHAMPPTRFA